MGRKNRTSGTRKIQTDGRGALRLNLPTSWSEKEGVEVGDEVIVRAVGEHLEVFPRGEEAEEGSKDPQDIVDKIIIEHWPVICKDCSDRRSRFCEISNQECTMSTCPKLRKNQDQEEEEDERGARD